LIAKVIVRAAERSRSGGGSRGTLPIGANLMSGERIQAVEIFDCADDAEVILKWMPAAYSIWGESRGRRLGARV